MLEELFSNCVFNKKLAFSGYFEQSWKTFWIFAFNFIHVVAIVLILSSDSLEHNETFSKYLSLLRGQRWLVSCPHGVNLLTNQIRPLKKVRQQQPKFFDNNNRAK